MIVQIVAVGLACLVWPVLARAQALPPTMSYESDEAGTVTLQFQKDGAVTGAYPQYTGHLKGRMTSANRIEGIWWQDQPSADDEKCDTAINGSLYWGKFTLIEDADGKAFHGMWGSCDDEPDEKW